jgi:type IV secretory pathway VirB10-like protein
MPTDPLATPPPPPVERLNRAVLLVAALIVMITLLVVALVVAPRTTPHAAQPPTAPLAAGTPGFLNRPPGTLPPAPQPPQTDQDYLRSLLERAGAGALPGGPQPSNPFAAPPLAPPPTAPEPAFAPLPAAPTAAAAVSPPPAPRDARREEFLRALRAPLAAPLPPSIPPALGAPPVLPGQALQDLLGQPGAPRLTGQTVPSRPSQSTPPAFPDPTAPPISSTGAAAASALTDSAGATPQPSGPAESMPPPPLPAAPPRSQAPGRSDVRAAANPRTAATTGADPTGATANGDITAAATGDAPRTTLAAGTLIPALLETEVNSDLPGPLLAQVSRDVYDLHQTTVVVPRGSRLLGRYDNRIAVGQRRLLVAWTRLTLPDGSSFDLPGLPGTDAAGAAGLTASVQNHLLRLFGDALLLSLLAVGADLSQPASPNLTLAPTAGSVASAAVGQQLADVGLQLVHRDLAVQPTLRLAAGTPFTVFVNGDLPLARAPRPRRP